MHVPKKTNAKEKKRRPSAKIKLPRPDKLRCGNPLTDRWGAPEMERVFSPHFKFTTWRKLWVALAEAERDLGLPISAKQIAELRRFADDVNYETAEKIEKQIRHDVMSHVHAYGKQAPSAKAVIHWGATSAYVTDNTDLIQMRAGLALIAQKVVNILATLADFAEEWAQQPTLAFTHFQPAQPTTVGRRACLWIQDFLFDLKELERTAMELPFLGVKGTTGTQASFLKLFEGDVRKVLRLDRLVAQKMGFPNLLPISGQTYPRKLDSLALNALSGFAQSAHKFAGDLRLLSHLKEVEEPFEKNQVGSSAMPYKRNPMRCERICGLARHLMILALDPPFTAANQWFERTLDDSANRRLSMSEAFLTADVIAETALNVAQGMVVYPAVCEAHLKAELPFMASENVLMEAVKQGGDRQDLHERIRKHAQAAAAEVKIHGRPNDLLRRLADDKAFAKVASSLDRLMNPKHYTGLAAFQTNEFLRRCLAPELRKREKWLGRTGHVRV
jgi:adenylosuccinate lyase